MAQGLAKVVATYEDGIAAIVDFWTKATDSRLLLIGFVVENGPTSLNSLGFDNIGGGAPVDPTRVHDEGCFAGHQLIVDG